MDTVLGLSLTSTSVGWVLVEGRDADGTILDHDDFDVPPTNGVQAVHTSEQASAAVLDAQAAAAGYDQRLHVVGVTWSDEAAAEAALLLESLTDAGFDNVVPIRFHDACDMLARAIAPVVGYDQAAVCVLDGESTIVVMVDNEAASRRRPSSSCPAARSFGPLVDHAVRPQLLAAERHRDRRCRARTRTRCRRVSRRRCRSRSSPKPGAELALARGAALASAQSTEFTDAEMLETVNSWRQDHEASRQRSYAGALTMLGAGAVDVRRIAVARAGSAPGAPPCTRSGPAGGSLGRARTRRRGPGSATGRGRDPGCPPGTQACAGARAGGPAAARRRSGAGQRARSRAGSAARGTTSGGTSAAGRAAQPAPAADEVARTAARAGARPAAAATTSAARSAIAVASAGKRSVNP